MSIMLLPNVSMYNCKGWTWEQSLAMGPNEWQVGRLVLCSLSIQVQRVWTIR